MSSEKLNRLAEMASRGCSEAEEEIFRFFIPKVQRISDGMWNIVNDPTSFEQDCYREIRRAITTYRPGGCQTFEACVMWHIHEKRRDHIKRRRRKYVPEYFPDLTAESRDGTEIEFEPEDPGALASVENSVIGEVSADEKIALLAEGDPRKLAILTEWMRGNESDSDVAALLAQRFDGTYPESHRKFIQRFRSRCQSALARAV